MILKRILLLILFLGNITNSILKGKNKIILLNGTSSAGKSRLAEALISILDDTTEIVNGDQVALQIAKEKFIKEYKRSPTSYEELYAYLNHFHNEGQVPGLWDEVRCQVYEKTYELFMSGKTVIIDFEYINTQNKLNECLTKLSNIPLFIVLVYCPLDKLFQHVTNRNQSEDKTEYRKLDLPFTGFFDLYKKRKSEQEIFVDQLKKNTVEKTLNQIKEKARQTEHDSTKLEMFFWMTDSRMKNIFSLFDFLKHQEVEITCKLGCNMMVNTGLFTPEQCAQQIVIELQKLQPN